MIPLPRAKGVQKAESSATVGEVLFSYGHLKAYLCGVYFLADKLEEDTTLARKKGQIMI